MNRLYLYRSICFATVFACLLTVSCGENGRKSNQTQKTSREFTLPSIPAIITNPSERADYLAGHYWDHLDFSDTSLINKPEILEQAFVNFLEIFPYVSEGALRLAIRKTFEGAFVDNKMFAHITGLFERYLFDPNAPMRNEEYYSLVLDHLIASPQIDELDKVRFRFQQGQVNKNRRGSVAADFVYTLSNGRQGAMHKMVSEFTILFFNNPGCMACSEYQQGLEYSPVITQLVGAGRLKILAMYVDEDLVSWEGYRSSIPSSWLNGYDASFVIRNDNLYDLRAIPSLYLLDREKRVLLKDALPHQIEEQLLYLVQNPQ